jgi:hypothetical protein
MDIPVESVELPFTLSTSDDTEEVDAVPAGTDGENEVEVVVVDINDVFYHKKISISDIMEDELGNIIGIFGMKWGSIKMKDYRKMCARQGIKGYKSENKLGMIRVIRTWCENLKEFGPVVDGGISRQGAQCAFRLMNILFSDLFANEFSSIGNTASREALDSGKAANDIDFWQRVQQQFMRRNEKFDCLIFIDDPVFKNKQHIDFDEIIPHSWKKLQKMWKNINSAFKVAKQNFTKSGTHSTDFYLFCHGKLHVYYLWKLLEQRPNMNDMVLATLPVNCQLNTEMDFMDSPTTNIDGTDIKPDINDPDVKPNIKKRRKSQSPAVSNYAGETTGEFERQKIKAIEDQVKFKHDFVKSEEDRRQRETLYSELTNLNNLICKLRDDRDKPNLDAASKIDIEIDISHYIIRKNEVKKELGM